MLESSFMSTNEHPQSVEHLYREHRRPILAYLIRLIDDREAAEDLCQETFLKALRGWAQHDQSANPIAWIYRIATNTAYDHLRRRRRAILTPLVEAIPGGYTPELWLGERELVRSALAQLPAHYREPLLLQVCAGHSLSEIADALDCTTSAVKMRLLRARERFRQLYQG
jgi:RNA polymerase sigma-70 factor (ECF subfamily)